MNKIKKYYYPCGKEINSLEEFTDFYNKCYYLNNSHFVEKQIEEILDKGIKSKEHVFKILAWKMGGIDHKRSQEDGFKIHYKYKKKSDNNDKPEIISTTEINDTKWQIVNQRGQVVEVKNICEYIAENYKTLNSMNDFISIYSDLVSKKDRINGIGTVYLITLVYFISNGKYPLYDRFAHQALIAILDENKDGIVPGGYVGKFELPDKTSKNAVKNHYDKYYEMIDKLLSHEGGFEKNRYNYRNYDRALWVYGHLFRNKK